MLKPILFNTEMVRAILDGRKRLYPKSGDNPLSADHLKNRLFNGISVNNSTGCWEWNKTKNNHGYGQLTVNKKTAFAHRLSYELFNGEIPNGSQVLHKCDNPSCINPAHLSIGTASDNMRDCYNRGRSKLKPNSMPGTQNPSAKLNATDVLEIRKLLKNGHRQHKIAKLFGISQSNVSDIKRGVIWNETHIV